jgi:hypothetical protein
MRFLHAKSFHCPDIIFNSTNYYNYCAVSLVGEGKGTGMNGDFGVDRGSLCLMFLVTHSL